MGEREINGGLEPIRLGEDVRWGVFAGSAFTRHTAPPDGLTLSDDDARALCEKASRVDVVDFEMSIPAMWRPWWLQLPTAERAAVWRGCRALWARMIGPRW